MGYVIIKYMDISEGDYKALQSERLVVGDVERIFHPKDFKGYINIPYPEPPIKIPNICDDEWVKPDREPLPLGSQRIVLDSMRRMGYVEFYYEKVVI